jgi:hypothetical protein
MIVTQEINDEAGAVLAQPHNQKDDAPFVASRFEVSTANELGENLKEVGLTPFRRPADGQDAKEYDEGCDHGGQEAGHDEGAGQEVAGKYLRASNAGDGDDGGDQPQQDLRPALQEIELALDGLECRELIVLAE